MKSEQMSNEMMNEYRRVAYYYYKAGLTQEVIAKRMKMSRQRVNRIVSACVELGIVKITIADLDKWNLELETELEQKYGLKEVRVIDNVVEDRLIQELGIAAGNYLQSIVKEGDIVGVTRGRTTAAMVDHWIPAVSYPENVTVTQLIGSAREEDSRLGADRIVYGLADRLGAEVAVLHAPVILHSASLRESFVGDPYYMSAYEVVKNCTIAVVGIGTADSQWEHMISLYDVENDEEKKWTEDVAGEVCANFFDREGQEAAPPFKDRIIAITMEDYKKIPVRIGVAGGEEKAEAIRAAVKGNYINVLVTDLLTAKLLKE
ncbi:MAG: sugar-binding transcriptional regulator [Dorea sp.]|nr:sugar-binding transcriptional regulator [Dorea sp.]